VNIDPIRPNTSCIIASEIRISLWNYEIMTKKAQIMESSKNTNIGPDTRKREQLGTNIA
jgi:hypothetical protein